MVSGQRRHRSLLERASYSIGLVAAVVFVGTVSMHLIEGWSYLDAFYFTSMIATGQGPPPNLAPSSAVGKVFTSVLAFVSVGTVVAALVFLFGPFLSRVIKAGVEKVEEVEREVEGHQRPGPSAARGRRGAGLVLVVLLLFLLVLLLAALLRVFARPGRYFLFFPFGFLILLILVLFVVNLMTRPWRGAGYWRRHGGAEEILRRRYARGDITREQFEQMMKDLREHS